MQLKIVSPERIEFAGAVSSVRVPGALGQFEILPKHAPIISSLTSGSVEWRASDGDASSVSRLAIVAGFVSVNNNEVSICVEV